MPTNDLTSTALTQAQYRAVLQWYADMGVDCAVSEDTTDWFGARFAPFTAAKPAVDTSSPHAPVAQGQNNPARQHNPAARVSKNPSQQQPNTFSGKPVETATLEARSKASQAKSLDELRIMVESFEGCPLKVTATKTCFAEGNADAPLMIIGEAPGREEDISGKPFVGRAGQLLSKMLEAIKLERAKDCYITNIVFWRPPGNRNPNEAEVEICRPFLDRQIELVNPKAILLLGAPAARSLLETSTGILKLRGKWKEITVNGQAYPVMATLHPAYLLRTPAAKMLAWQDMLAVRAKLGE